VCHRVQLGASLKVFSGVYLRASCELTWERIVKQAGSLPSSAIGILFESILGSVLESILKAYMGAYIQAG